MSQQITTAFVRKYTAGIRLLQQQMDARLRAGVMTDDTVPGDRAFYDQVDATAMSEVTNRHGDTEYTDTPHARRMVTMKTYEVADLVDRADTRRLLNNPMNSYSRSMAAAANRQFDDIIIAAFQAAAGTGVDGTGTAPYVTATNTFQNDATAEDGLGLPMTIGALTLMRSKLEEQENNEDDGENKWFAALHAKARQDLLDEDPTAGPTLTNSDYAAVRALVNGQINTFLGFHFLKSQRLVNSTVGTFASTLCPFWVKKSMQLGVSEESRGFMDVLPAKRHSTQVRYEMDAGAVRMDEVGVFHIEVAV